MPWTDDFSGLNQQAADMSDGTLSRNIKVEVAAFLDDTGSGAGMWLAVLVNEAHDRGYYIYA